MTVTATILPLNVFQMDALGDFCVAKLGKRLPDKLEKSTTGNYAYVAQFFFIQLSFGVNLILKFRLALRGLTLGPLGYDIELANKAIVGLGWVVHLLLNLY